MGIMETGVTSKGQTTIPIEVRDSLNIMTNSRILWIPMRPGEFSIIKKNDYKSVAGWADSLCGIIEDDSWDSLEELLKYKKEDLELDKRGIDIN